MKRKLIIASIVIGLGYLIFRYGLILWFIIFTHRGDGELRPEEIKLFNELKKELYLKKIERTPEYNISNPKKDRSYNIYFEYIDCNVSKDSLKKLAEKIVLRVDEKIVLSHKFSSVELIFEHWDCTPGDISFYFSRKDIYDLQNKNK